jgi:hypothetical protein
MFECQEVALAQEWTATIAAGLSAQSDEERLRLIRTLGSRAEFYLRDLVLVS